MQTITRTYNVYKFDELTDEAKQKALETYSDYNDFDGMLDGSVDCIEEMLFERGFDDVDVRYDISYSQGSGASFTAGSVDIKKWLAYYKLEHKFTILLDYLDDVYANIRSGSSHYYHEKTTSSNVETDFEYLDELTDDQHNKLNEETEFLVKILDEDVEETNRMIYKTLLDDYEAQTSEDAIIESFEANDVVFTEDGKIFY